MSGNAVRESDLDVLSRITSTLISESVGQTGGNNWPALGHGIALTERDATLVTPGFSDVLADEDAAVSTWN